MKKVYVKNRYEWRDWLLKNHDKEKDVWLVYYKKETGRPTLKYDDSVEEALCFGWIDSIIKKVDEEKYVRKFTPRKPDSYWSEPNKQRVEKMIKAGLMTPHGLNKIEAAKKTGVWDKNARPQLSFEMHPEFEEALKKNSRAKEIFENLSPSHKKQYLGWIEVAKRPETKERRIKEAITLLEKGEKLGLK
jgi:uncharacterized protein YdeI (YjbR/CyaY-like superfamily)